MITKLTEDSSGEKVAEESSFYQRFWRHEMQYYVNTDKKSTLLITTVVDLYFIENQPLPAERLAYIAIDIHCIRVTGHKTIKSDLGWSV